ncbi:inositol polyphosphate kinase [Saccharomycopsis crataegensis]|uniref:Inositol hexakisphosphate and diphosphoinositol-pentakisphosphate kinase n=1 Tax=Saccharomycopsis crataegensis TaxID=43959 RepID=A0AAV5QSJ4_9ASCO|nr:inositol polyphosphate kinase [Saccharomycopsis crataegensis]
MSSAGDEPLASARPDESQTDSVEQNTKRAIDSIAPYLEKFSPVTSSSESKSLQPKDIHPPFFSSDSNLNIQTIHEDKDEDNADHDTSKTDTAKSSGEAVNNTAKEKLAPKLKYCGVKTSKDQVPSNPKDAPKIYGKIGICAMDAKVLSKPCREILNRLIKFGEFETVIFGEKSILDESIESWPVCDFLICFFSNGFPLDKAIDYANLRKPFLINDLIMQKVLWDRRLCLRLLEAANVPTPYRLEISRDGGPVNFIGDDLKQKLIGKGVNVDPIPEPEWKMIDDDTLWVDGRILTKPFVEKPVDGEDHNVYIYYPVSTGGGGRRLFRKVGNKSSEYDASLNMIRTNGSFIYEKFMDTDNLEDVKAYTVGQEFCHAETRKSPVVDGIVRRNTRGKELRYVTTLSDEEKEMAKRVSKYFDQTICGFDILRAQNQSFVIDVNGFSFVKDNTEYYEACSQILRNIFKKVSPNYQITKALEEEQCISEKSPGNAAIANNVVQDSPKASKNPNKKSDESKNSHHHTSSKWVFKGLVTVIRHADRTPKQKFKYSFRSPIFISLLKGHKEEVIIRQVSDLEIVLQAIRLAEEQKSEDPDKLHLLSTTLEKKKGFPGTKIQLKPVLNEDNEVEKVQFILKWGGEPTHSAKYQATDLGETTRQDIQLLNKEAFKNVKVYTSSERRVIVSAKLWSQSFLEEENLPEDFLKIRKDLLDDSNAAKDLMDKVKKKIKPLLRQGIKPPKQFAWPPKYPDPYYVTKRVVELMNYHHKVMEYNFKHYGDLDALQERWCCNEDPYLLKERWDKLFKEFTTFEKVDPSKISELYDTMKFDALHNRDFLQNIFCPPDLDECINHEDDDELKEFSEAFFKSPVLCDAYPINVLAMNNFQLPSDQSNNNSSTTSRSNSSVKLSTGKYLNVKPIPKSNTPAGSAISSTLSSSVNSVNTKSATEMDSASSSLSSTTSGNIPSSSAGSLGWVLKSDFHSKQSPISSSTFDDPKFNRLRELYKLAKVLFDFVCPQEYGIENNEKLDIGLLTSLPLAKQVLADITTMVETSNPATVAYFTKESHIYTLLNIIYESKLPMRIERNALPELDYLSQIVFELYERSDENGAKKHSIRLSLSPGCHTQDPLDIQLDNKHYISNIPRISLTRHLDTDLLIQKLKSRFSRVSMPKKFIPVNISSPLVIDDSKGKQEFLKK